MLPLATSVLNTEAIGLLQSWITNLTSSGVSPNLRISGLDNGSFRVRFDGIPSTTYQIEYSDEAEPFSWQYVRTTNSDAFGMFEVIDTPPLGIVRRYYRSVYP